MRRRGRGGGGVRISRDFANRKKQTDSSLPLGSQKSERKSEVFFLRHRHQQRKRGGVFHQVFSEAPTTPQHRRWRQRNTSFPLAKTKRVLQQKKSLSLSNVVSQFSSIRGIENQQHTQKAKLFPFSLSWKKKPSDIFVPPFFPAGDEEGEEEESHFAKAKHNRKSKGKKSHPPLSKKRAGKKKGIFSRKITSQPKKKPARY